MTSNDTLVDQRPFYFTHIAVDPKDQITSTRSPRCSPKAKTAVRKFKEIAKDIHVDYHAIWIDPTNPKRIMVGEDGGYALTADLEHWSFSRNLTIGQIYHVGLSNENPYLVCVAFQDNGGFCGPSNSLDSEGILDRHWIDVVGGDGMWTMPDPDRSELHLGRSGRRRTNYLRSQHGRRAASFVRTIPSRAASSARSI